VRWLSHDQAVQTLRRTLPAVLTALEREGSENGEPVAIAWCNIRKGHTCTNVPIGVQACDHLVEQIPPTAVWGTHFLSASYFTRSSGELYRILTASNSTTVTVNCNTFSQPQTFSLTSAGSWTEFRTKDNTFCSIESNNPLLVMEFSLRRSVDGVGDPFMMMIPSVDQYTNDYAFHSPSEFSNYITILVTPQYYQPEQILVDGVSQENANWAPVPCANGSVCGYCAYVTLEPGDHHVWHSDSFTRISVLMYGFTRDNSYGQLAGMYSGTREKSKSHVCKLYSIRFSAPIHFCRLLARMQSCTVKYC